MKIKSVSGKFLLSIFIMIIAGFCVTAGAAGAVVQTPDADDNQAAPKSEEIDKTIDKAIKVLTVIRDDLKDDKKAAADKASVSAVTEESAAATAGKWVARVNRMWKNVKRAVSDDGGDASTTEEADVIDTEQLSVRISQAIEMMNVIKEEIEKDNKTQEGTNGT